MYRRFNRRTHTVWREAEDVRFKGETASVKFNGEWTAYIPINRTSVFGPPRKGYIELARRGKKDPIKVWWDYRLEPYPS